MYYVVRHVTLASGALMAVVCYRGTHSNCQDFIGSKPMARRDAYTLLPGTTPTAWVTTPRSHRDMVTDRAVTAPMTSRFVRNQQSAPAVSTAPTSHKAPTLAHWQKVCDRADTFTSGK